VRVLVAEVLPALALPAPGRLLDIGSGNGSPGLVFALLREDLEVTLLEPRLRRWAFLREAVRAAAPARPVSVVRGRHDGYEGPLARTVSLRALRLPLGELDRLLAPGGEVLVLGAPPEAQPPFEAVPLALPGRADLHLFRRSGVVPRGT